MNTPFTYNVAKCFCAVCVGHESFHICYDFASVSLLIINWRYRCTKHVMIQDFMDIIRFYALAQLPVLPIDSATKGGSNQSSNKSAVTNILPCDIHRLLLSVDMFHVSWIRYREVCMYTVTCTRAMARGWLQMAPRADTYKFQCIKQHKFNQQTSLAYILLKVRRNKLFQSKSSICCIFQIDIKLPFV